MNANYDTDDDADDLGPMDELMRTREVSQFLRVTRAKLRRLREEPDFPVPFVLGPRSLRWSRLDLEQFVAGRRKKVEATR